MIKNSCNNCDCWKESKLDMQGECRRYPPKIVTIVIPFQGGEVEDTQPASIITKSLYYCGEWRVIPTEQVGIWPFVIGVIRLLRG